VSGRAHSEEAGHQRGMEAPVVLTAELPAGALQLQTLSDRRHQLARVHSGRVDIRVPHDPRDALCTVRSRDSWICMQHARMHMLQDAHMPRVCVLLRCGARLELTCMCMPPALVPVSASPDTTKQSPGSSNRNRDVFSCGPAPCTPSPREVFPLSKLPSPK
jgi:hypothetical protein